MRNAGQRGALLNPPIRACAPPSLSHLLISFPPGRGSGRARGAAWRVRVCDCNEGPLARDHWVCTINNEGALKKKMRGASAELGRGPPQAAWRGAVVHPSGGPSAPGRRCWRLGRKRPSPFSNSGPTPLRSDPNLEGLKSLRCCCAKGVGHRAQLMLRARRGDRENNHPVPLLRTPTPQNALSLLSSLRGVTTTKSLD